MTTEIIARSAGRPPMLTEAVRNKIEDAAAHDCSITEIALYAGISRQTLHRWLKDDEALRDRIEELREYPVLYARQTIVRAVKTDPNAAFRYLERKRPKEFMPTAKLEHGGNITLTPGQAVDPALQRLADEYNEKVRNAIVASFEVINPPAQETSPEQQTHVEKDQSDPAASDGEGERQDRGSAEGA